MDNESLAAQAVANMPMTAAPPSFDGHGWLVVINMGLMTAAAMIAGMVVGLLLNDAARSRKIDRGLAPARVFRLGLLLMASGITMRCGVEALALWGWNPADPTTTGGYLTAKRLVDPIAISCGLSGLILFALAMPGMLRQLRNQPIVVDIWQSWPMVQRMLMVAALSLVAAIGVVSTR